MKILTIVGARPQFVKAATVSRVLLATPGIREVLVHTGQHYDHNVSGVFFAEMEIPKPSFDLGIGSGPHGRQTGRMIESIESLMLDERPNGVLVYGDTNSTLAGAIAASKLHLPVAHVEAGLRSFNRRMPEEVNRVLTDHVSDLLFAPTEAAVRNLKQEGISGDRVVRTGDVMYDAALFYGAKAERRACIIAELGLRDGEFVLATVHRAENTDDPERLRSIMDALRIISRTVPVVLPLHPRTRAVLDKIGENQEAPGQLKILEPVGYFDMITLERHARVIVTDSGGVQKEASFHNVRCVTLRNETEWEELIETGRNTLAPPEMGASAIAQTVLAALTMPQLEPADIYGDGHAAEAIVETLVTRGFRDFSPNP